MNKRWAWDEQEQRMKPVINFIHIIPIENASTLIHCAQSTCWCSPKQDVGDSAIFLHNAVSSHVDQGWILIGERVDLNEDSIDS